MKWLILFLLLTSGGSNETPNEKIHDNQVNPGNTPDPTLYNAKKTDSIVLTMNENTETLASAPMNWGTLNT